MELDLSANRINIIKSIDVLSNRELKEQIINNCKKISMVEACGLITINRETKKIFVIKGDNIANDPFNNFLLDRKFIELVSETNFIIGYYHSHYSGSAEPSIQDQAVINKLKLKCVIWDNVSGAITETNPEDLEFIPPYVGRPFLAGILDCSELVKDYYKKSLNIILPTLSHPIKFMSWAEIQKNWDSLQSFNSAEYMFFLNYFLDNGFQEVAAKDLKANDIILCRAKEIAAPVHALIYLGDGKILHHPSQRDSILEYYSDFYKKLSVKYIRYKDLF